MKRKFTTALMFSLFALASISLPTFASAAYRTYTFDDGLAPFKAAAFRAEDLTPKTLTLQTEPGAIKGTNNGYAALVSNLGAPVFMQGDVPVQASKLVIKLRARDLHNCLSCMVAVYAGATPPASLADFTTDYLGIGPMWGTHKFNVAVKPDPTDRIGPSRMIVAVTYFNLDMGVDKESQDVMLQAIGIDDLSIQLQDAVAAPATTSTVALPAVAAVNN